MEQRTAKSNRTKEIRVKFSYSELRSVVVLAKKCGKTTEEFIRILSMDAVERAISDKKQNQTTTIAADVHEIETGNGRRD